MVSTMPPRCTLLRGRCSLLRCHRGGSIRATVSFIVIPDIHTPCLQHYGHYIASLSLKQAEDTIARLSMVRPCQCTRHRLLTYTECTLAPRQHHIPCHVSQATATPSNRREARHQVPRYSTSASPTSSVSPLMLSRKRNWTISLTRRSPGGCFKTSLELCHLSFCSSYP
jgi:hypothetical protein